MEATETFAAGGEQFTVAVQIGTTNNISGDISGVLGDAHIIGDLNLTGDLIIEGLLTGIDIFTLEGNGFQLLFQNGGRPNLAGVEKTAWIRWGETPVGWTVGDRVAVAPTAVGVYVPTEILWGAAQPINSPDVTLVDGTVARPEVVNLTQTIVLKNLRRIHFHNGAGVASLKWLKVLNSGTAGVLSEYPIHFHLNGEASRGSLVEGVVVEGGKNHAFVPHGSHGIRFKDCVAYKIIDDAYWWDPPFGNLLNNSNDILYHKCLALSVDAAAASPHSVSGFDLGSGSGNECVDSVASCVRGGNNSAGFSWQETSNNPPNVWLFEDDVAHNNKMSGSRVWQNNDDIHLISRYVGYRNKWGINHGAYRNRYHYDDSVITGNELAVRSHALTTTSGNILFEDILTDGPLEISKHNTSSPIGVIYRRCTFTQVLMRETFNGGVHPGIHFFEDCGLTPADFDMAGVLPGTTIDITEAGVLVHRWASGSWS